MSHVIQEISEALPLKMKLLIYSAIIFFVPFGETINPMHWYWTDWTIFAMKIIGLGFIAYRAIKNRNKK